MIVSRMVHILTLGTCMCLAHCFPEEYSVSKMPESLKSNIASGSQPSRVCEVGAKAVNNGWWQIEAYVKHSAKCGRSAVIKVAIQLSIAVSSSIPLSEIDDESGKHWVAVGDILASASVLSQTLRWVSMLS